MDVKITLVDEKVARFQVRDLTGSGDWHEVRLEKETKKWHCDCDNVRLEPCKHIKRLKNGK